MRSDKLTCPTVELFSDGEILDAYDLNRRGAFSVPMGFPFRRLRSYRDHIELRWRDRNKPPQIILLERTKLNYGGARPWFLCYKCGRRCARLYATSIDVACRKCADLQFTSQRQRRRARLQTKAENIRNRLWTEGEKLIRPFRMRRTTYQKIPQSIAPHRTRHPRTNGRFSSIRYRRWRERDDEERYFTDDSLTVRTKCLASFPR